MSFLEPRDISDAFDTIKAHAPYDRDLFELIDIMERRLILAETALAKVRDYLRKDSALGDARMPSADDPSGVRPLAVAGVENNVVDLQRYSWRVDGGA